MYAMDFTPETRAVLWAESLNTANDLENISSNSVHKKLPDELFSGAKTKLFGNLIEFGRIGYVAIQKKIKKKWKE